MNTPELKVGQRFLSRLEAGNEITEVTVKRVTADGAFIKCFWKFPVVNNGYIQYDEKTQWFAAGELSFLHVLEEAGTTTPHNPDISGPPPFDKGLLKNTVFSIEAKKVQHDGSQWFIRAIIEANINGQLLWSAIESSGADDDSPETLKSKVTDVINCIPERFAHLFNQQKPVTAMGLDPAWITDIKEANE